MMISSTRLHRAATCGVSSGTKKCIIQAPHSGTWISSLWLQSIIFLFCISSIPLARSFDPLPDGNTCYPQGTPCTPTSLGGVVDEWIAGGTRRAAVVAKYGKIEEWDVSEVTTAALVFFQKTSFNADISKWDVSEVTTTRYMCHQCTSFNSDISKWNVGKLTTMSHMFEIAGKFNSDVSKWNVANVVEMKNVFRLSGFNGDLSKWVVDKVTDMSQMFNTGQFKKTLCGSAWTRLKDQTPYSWQYKGGQHGCCPAGKYMSNPMANPFSEDNSCSSCPTGQSTSSKNDDTTCTLPPSCISPISTTGYHGEGKNEFDLTTRSFSDS